MYVPLQPHSIFPEPWSSNQPVLPPRYGYTSWFLMRCDLEWAGNGIRRLEKIEGRKCGITLHRPAVGRYTASFLHSTECLARTRRIHVELEVLVYGQYCGWEMIWYAIVWYEWYDMIWCVVTPHCTSAPPQAPPVHPASQLPDHTTSAANPTPKQTVNKPIHSTASIQANHNPHRIICVYRTHTHTLHITHSIPVPTRKI